MLSRPLTAFPIFAAISLSAGPLKGDCIVRPDSFAAISLFVEIPLPADLLKKELSMRPNLFATTSLFSKITRLDLRAGAARSDDAQLKTEFPYPFYIDDEYEYVSVPKANDHDALTAEDESAAPAGTFLFPQPRIYRNNLATRFGRRTLRSPAFFRGASLFAKIR